MPDDNWITGANTFVKLDLICVDFCGPVDTVKREETICEYAQHWLFFPLPPLLWLYPGDHLHVDRLQVIRAWYVGVESMPNKGKGKKRPNSSSEEKSPEINNRKNRFSPLTQATTRERSLSKRRKTLEQLEQQHRITQCTEHTDSNTMSTHEAGGGTRSRGEPDTTCPSTRGRYHGQTGNRESQHFITARTK